MPPKQSKKNNRRNGALFSPELLEVVSRLKRREPELDEILKRQQKKTTGREK